jgi:hypothetical protein
MMLLQCPACKSLGIRPGFVLLMLHCKGCGNLFPIEEANFKLVEGKGGLSEHRTKASNSKAST